VQDQGHNGKLFFMALLARLLPRDWDGRRLLQFLTGLALLALAFAAPAAPAAAAPAPAPVVVTPAGQAGPAVEAPAADGSAPVVSAVARGVERQDLCLRHASGTTRVADTTVVLTGATRGSRGSRGPPPG
jgi:hypothetical protein